MANLRSMLGKEFGSTIQATAGQYGSYSKVRSGRVLNYHPWCNNDGCGYDGYRGYYMQHWCVPCGTTQITFELWGGGGGGGGACNCMSGIPGGAGAYARKTLHTCDHGQDMGGWCYYFCVGRPTHCASGCHGVQGCKTYICGCQLDNFCAEGGLPGKTCCCAFWHDDFRCKSRVYFWDGSSNGGECGGYNPCTACSLYYGADFGIGGKPGFFNTYDSSNNCYAKLMLPYPARLIDDMGGHMTSQNKGDHCLNDGAFCHGTTPWAHNEDCSAGPGLPGTGAPSATSKGGGCCCGWRGGGGFIKVTYCSCWMETNQSCAWHFCN